MERETSLSNLRCLAAYPFIGKASGENPEDKFSLGPVKTHASRDLVSSKTFWFCLEPRSIQLPSTTTRRFPYLGHIGLTV
jgi:hypothetical protein